MTLVDLEFDTGTKDGVLLGDIASSLVSLDELLRDLASLAADRSSAEFRNIEIVAIELRRPLKIKLSLLAISADAVKAFQEICRNIINKVELERCIPDDVHARLSDTEVERMSGHIRTLQNAEVVLRRFRVTEE